jgi:hypothetical protein
LTHHTLKFNAIINIKIYRRKCIHKGKGGGGRVEPERRGEGQHRRVQIPKAGLKIPT